MMFKELQTIIIYPGYAISIVTTGTQIQVLMRLAAENKSSPHDSAFTAYIF